MVAGLHIAADWLLVVVVAAAVVVVAAAAVGVAAAAAVVAVDYLNPASCHFEIPS